RGSDEGGTCPQCKLAYSMVHGRVKQSSKEIPEQGLYGAGPHPAHRGVCGAYRCCASPARWSACAPAPRAFVGTINMHTKRMLITGGAGFIGCNAARFFAMRNWQVTILDNLSRQGTDRNL